MVAAIYTPFVRVAFAAKAAHSEGRAMTPDDVHDALLRPELYVAFRGGSDDIATSFAATGFNLQSASAYKVALPGDRFPPSSRPDLNIRLVASPLWVTEELTILTDFGAEPPFDDTVLIAAYPMSVLASGHDFVIYRTFRPSNGDTYGRQYRVGRVLASDLTWR